MRPEDIVIDENTEIVKEFECCKCGCRFLSIVKRVGIEVENPMCEVCVTLNEENT